MEQPGREKWKGRREHLPIRVSADPVSPGPHSRAGNSLLAGGKKSFQLPRCPVRFCLQLKHLWLTSVEWLFHFFNFFRDNHRNWPAPPFFSQ